MVTSASPMSTAFWYLSESPAFSPLVRPASMPMKPPMIANMTTPPIVAAVLFTDIPVARPKPRPTRPPTIAPMTAAVGEDDPATSRASRTLFATTPTRSGGKPAASIFWSAAFAASSLRNTPTTVTSAISTPLETPSRAVELGRQCSLVRERRGAYGADAHVCRRPVGGVAERAEALPVALRHEAVERACRVVAADGRRPERARDRVVLLPDDRDRQWLRQCARDRRCVRGRELPPLPVLADEAF